MPRGRGWRRVSRSSISGNRKRFSRQARLSNGSRKVTSNEVRRQRIAMTASGSTTKEGSLIGSMSHAWRALRHRNFQLFFFGQSISVIGNWMTRLATTWLVYRMTHSALLLGIVSFAGQIVSFALGPFAGVWVERLNRRKLLVWTQGAAAVQSLALAALTLAHVVTLGEIIALTA